MKRRLARNFVWLSLAMVLAWSKAGAAPASTQRGQSEFKFADGKKVSVEYGQARAADSQVFGNVVPFGKVWGTGEGRATRLTTEVPIQIDEVTVPPGTYSMYTLPSQGDWILILNQKSDQSASDYPAGFDFARIKMKKRSLTEPTNVLNISFDSHGPGGGAMKVRWGSTEVWINFEENLNTDQGEGDAS